MADEHSEPGGMKVLRLYADALGESRFETTTMPMGLKEFAPPAAPFRVSDPQPAQNYVILEIGAEWGGAVPHPSPARIMAFSLSGCTRVTASSGESHTFVAGDCLLHDDTTGKGSHIGRACAMGIYPPLKRRPRCKRNLTISEAFGCGHVFGL